MNAAGDDSFRGDVPTWEIDQNDHWNTAFYLRAFQQAAEQFARATSGAAARPDILHVRFFRELRVLEAFRIVSFRLSGARAPYHVLHVMRGVPSGNVCASALELSGRSDVPAPVDGEDAEAYAPRSLPPGREAPADADRLLGEGRATVSHAGILRPEDFDASGDILLTSLHRRVSDGNGPLWQHHGVSSDAFQARGLGRAIVELKVSAHQQAKPGTPVRQVSWFDGVGRKSVSIRHQLENLVTGEVLSNISTVTLAIDMQARRSTDWPEDLAQALAGI